MPRAFIVIGRIAWVVPVIFGFGLLNWVGFLYPAIRMRRQHPIWLRILYLSVALNVIAIIILGAVPNGSPWIGVYFLVWLASIIGFFIMLKWWIPFDTEGNAAPPDPVSPRISPGQSDAQTSQNIDTDAQVAGRMKVEEQTPKSPESAPAEPVVSEPDTSTPAPNSDHGRDGVDSPYAEALTTSVDDQATDQPEDRRAKVFISHATEDRESTLRLAQELESQGIDTWLAFRDVQVGDNYAEEIVKAIVAAEYLLVVLSESAIESPHVRREVTIGIDRGVPLLPVNMSASEDFMWSLPVDWTYWLSLAQVLRHTDEIGTAQELARRIGRQ